ncbi:hypothetical protein DX933_16535 [Ornithinibacillus gellani]|uniref:hypothetical protein n=1 Tax=Ornithinibacillus gellani TaxID=2293253 RepID=UPI000F477AAE|nr:hypothetical protein [Ornithinibacillus gellani]TQS70971.1 hypothetical protein DX933_16535 [Ornithinibacillus gellani]
MFEELFVDELSKHVGSRVEVTTDNNVVEGILSGVTEELILVIDVIGGYGLNNRVYIAVDFINYVRFPVAV